MLPSWSFRRNTRLLLCVQIHSLILRAPLPYRFQKPMSLKADSLLSFGLFWRTWRISRPQHVVDLAGCQESGANVLSAITAFTNMLLDGKCHRDVVPVLFGGTPHRFWRRNPAASERSPLVTPGDALPLNVPTPLQVNRPNRCSVQRQLGVAISGGCEAAIHATRRFAEAMPSGHAIVKLDFSNAFNSLHRDAMSECSCRCVPWNIQVSSSHLQ